MQLTQQEINSQLQLKQNKPLVYEKMSKFDEKIQKDESITVIHIQYDTICNMYCEHCCVPQDKFIKNTNRVLTVDDIRNIFIQADELGLAKADITGGEPTLFKDLDDIIKAINPEKFWIQIESNGYLITEEKAKHFKSIGIDKIQLSLDSLNENEHDSFRKKRGSWKRVIDAIDFVKDAGLSVAINTVVTHNRIYSNEFIDFLVFCNNKGVTVNLCLSRPVGRWDGHYDDLLTKEDYEYIVKLSKTYNISDYVNISAFGRKPGCFPFRRMLTITKYGDVLPCLHLQFKVGNIFETPLKTLIEKGKPYFSQYEPTCLAANIDFIEKYTSKTLNRTEPDLIENILPLNWRELNNK